MFKLKKNSILPERLKSKREQLGLTQEKVSEKLNISIGTLSGYERGYRKPNPEMLEKLADLYNESTDWLIGRDEFLRNSNVKSYKTYENESNMSQKEYEKMLKEMVEIAEKYRPKKA